MPLPAPNSPQMSDVYYKSAVLNRNKVGPDPNLRDSEDVVLRSLHPQQQDSSEHRLGDFTATAFFRHLLFFSQIERNSPPKNAHVILAFNLGSRLGRCRLLENYSITIGYVYGVRSEQ